MSKDPKNAMQCSQFEALLADALDEKLLPDARQVFEAHSAECQVCGPMWAEAREGMLWLRGLEEQEPPRNLVHNILAATSLAGKAAREQAGESAGWLDRLRDSIRPAFAGVLRSRFATSFSMAFFSITLTMTLAGVKLPDLFRALAQPSTIQKAVVLRYTSLESSVIRYYENMRLVYEVESRVRELKKVAAPQNNDSDQQPQKKKKTGPNDTSGDPGHHEDYTRYLNDGVVASLKTSHEGARI